MNFDWDAIEARLDEYRQLAREPDGNGLSLLEAALFLEEALGITLTDDEIVRANLGTFPAIREFVARRLGHA